MIADRNIADADACRALWLAVFQRAIEAVEAAEAAAENGKENAA